MHVYLNHYHETLIDKALTFRNISRQVNWELELKKITKIINVTEIQKKTIFFVYFRKSSEEACLTTILPHTPNAKPQNEPNSYFSLSSQSLIITPKKIYFS